MSDWVSSVDATSLFVVVAAIAVVLALLIMRLKQGHAAAWARMGAPALFGFRGGYKARWALFRFLFSDEHRALGDGGLSALVWVMRGLIVAAVVIVVVLAMDGRLRF